MPLESFEMHFDCVNSQNLGTRSGSFQGLRSRCGALCIFTYDGNFSWQEQRKSRILVFQNRFFVLGTRHLNYFTSKCKFRGTLVVIVEEFRFHDRCNESWFLDMRFVCRFRGSRNIWRTSKYIFGGGRNTW